MALPTSRPLLPIALACALAPGCGLVLGLDDFADAPTRATSTGVGGTTSTSGTTSTTVASSGGGAGGAPPTCTALGTPFDIITPADVQGHALLDKSLIVVGGVNYTYVSIRDDTGRMTVQEVAIDPGSALKDRLTWVPGVGPGSVTMRHGRAAGGKLTFYGTIADDIARVEFPGEGAGSGTATSLPSLACVPCDADAGPCPSHVANAAFAFDAQEQLHYAATSVTQGSPPVATLCYGTEISGPTTLGAGPFDMNSGIDLAAQALTVSGATLLLRTGADGPGAVFFSSGTSAAELTQRHPFSLTAEAGQLTAALGGTPLPNDGGALIFAATLDAVNLAPAALWSASIPVTQYADLAKNLVPPPGFTKKLDFATADELVLIEPSAYSTNHVIAAGPNFSQSRVEFFQFDRAGNPEVVAHTAFAAPPMVSLLAAAAAFKLGPQRLVVWVEKSADQPPEFSVRGQALNCN